MARLLPQVPGMTYAHDDDDLYVTFYADSETRVQLNGVEVGVRQTTAYPNDGKISVVVQPTKPTQFRILLRIPTWARDQFVPGDLYRYAEAGSESFAVSVNGAPVAATVRRGFVAVDRRWTSGDKIDLTLPMPVRVATCHSAVEANRNRVAFTRGPLVLCAEGVDNGGATQRFFVDDTADVSQAPSWTQTIATGSFQQVSIPARAVTKDGGAESAHLVLTPYYAWNNRGVSSMTVWFPRLRELAVFDPNALPKESVFAKITASHTFVDDTVFAVGDNKEPKYSSGRKVARWTSRPQKGKEQWVETRFHETKALRSVGVYWMQDRKDVKFPAAWSMEVEQGGQWKPFELYVTDEYGTRANQYNVVHPAAPLKCDAIRIRMTPQENACVGILEIRPELD